METSVYSFRISPKNVTYTDTMPLIKILMLLLVGSTIKIVVFVKLTWVAMAVMLAVSPALPVGGWMYCACRERKIIIANI